MGITLEKSYKKVKRGPGLIVLKVAIAYNCP
jgi:hypothetical protein